MEDQSTQFHLQPFILGTGKGDAEWATDTSGDSGDGGFQERIEGVPTRILMLNHSPYCKSHLAQAEDSSPLP